MGSPPTSTRHLLLEDRSPLGTPTLRRLPGKARPGKAVLLECEAEVARLRERLPRVLWPFLIPDLTLAFRWRVQLDCDCVLEVLTREDETPPHEKQWQGGAGGSELPLGQMICRHDDASEAPYRAITEWGDRREVTFPADPVEPRSDIDPEVWSLIRHDEPRTSAFWKVTLACGHQDEAIAPSLDWTPESEPHRVDPQRVQQMSSDFEEAWRKDPGLQTQRDREHTRRMLAAGWPSPRPEELCYTCPHVRMIMAYERVGWLVPRPGMAHTKALAARRPSRSTLERRLRRVEAEAERLRAELDQPD